MFRHKPSSVLIIPSTFSLLITNNTKQIMHNYIIKMENSIQWKRNTMNNTLDRKRWICNKTDKKGVFEKAIPSVSSDQGE